MVLLPTVLRRVGKCSKTILETAIPPFTIHTLLLLRYYNPNCPPVFFLNNCGFGGFPTNIRARFSDESAEQHVKNVEPSFWFVQLADPELAMVRFQPVRKTAKTHHRYFFNHFLMLRFVKNSCIMSISVLLLYTTGLSVDFVILEAPLLF